MKTILTTSILVILLTVGCNQIQGQLWGGKQVRGNGNVTTKTVTTGEYDSIKLRGSMNVHIEQGTEGKIRVKTDDNIHEYLDIKADGNVLILSVKNGINLRTLKGIEIYIPVTDISGVSITGSGDVDANTMLKGENFKTSITGSGNLKLGIEASEISSNITGSGNMDLKGTTKQLNISITGSGDFDGENLQAKETNIKISGSGDAKVVALETINSKVSGSGDIRYTGSPKHVNSKTSGSGSISSF